MPEITSDRGCICLVAPDPGLGGRRLADGQPDRGDHDVERADGRVRGNDGDSGWLARSGFPPEQAALRLAGTSRPRLPIEFR